jgi:O-antigen ligase
MLGLAAIFALTWWKSRHKTALTLVLVVGLAFAVPRMSDNLRDRYVSIISSETKNASTAEGRVHAWWTGLGVAMHRPLFGHGLGCSGEAQYNFANSGSVAHNLYVETAQELGFVGLAILLALIASIARNVLGTIRQLRLRADKRPLLLRTADGLQVFLGMNLLFSMASYGLTSYEWYLTAGLSEVLARLAGTEPAAERVPRAVPEYEVAPASRQLAPPQSAR